MPNYRIYLIDSHGKIIEVSDAHHASDDDACTSARRTLGTGERLEVWSNHRCILQYTAPLPKAADAPSRQPAVPGIGAFSRARTQQNEPASDVPSGVTDAASAPPDDIEKHAEEKPAGRPAQSSGFDRQVGKRIRFMRQISNLTEDKAAIAIGITFNQLQACENGASRLSVILLAQFAGLFHLPLDWFVQTSAPAQSHNASGNDAIRRPVLYGDVMQQLYQSMQNRNGRECQHAVDLLCQFAGVALSPSETRLVRLRRAMQDGAPAYNASLLQMATRLGQLEATVGAGPPPLRAHGPSILLVDDDPDVLKVTSTTLSASGFAVITAACGNDALLVLASGASVDAIVSDYAMVGMDGMELLAQAREIRPGIPALIITGFADSRRLWTQPANIRVLSKPLASKELIRQIRLMIAGAPAPDQAQLVATADERMLVPSPDR